MDKDLRRALNNEPKKLHSSICPTLSGAKVLACNFAGVRPGDRVAIAHRRHRDYGPVSRATSGLPAAFEDKALCRYSVEVRLLPGSHQKVDLKKLQ